MKAILALGFLLSMACMAADDVTAGKYAGTWEGGAANGDFRLTLAKDTDGKLTPEVVFTLSGDEVKTKVTSFQIDGAKVKFVYTFDLQGNHLESSAEGERKGDTVEGKYTTRLLPDGGAIDAGTWRATLTQ